MFHIDVSYLIIHVVKMIGHFFIIIGFEIKTISAEYSLGSFTHV